MIFQYKAVVQYEGQDEQQVGFITSIGMAYMKTLHLKRIMRKVTLMD